jgi:hypothetical protein
MRTRKGAKMRVTFIFLMSASALLLFAPGADAAPFTNPLTGSQVTCDELQLERLALRVTLVQSASDFAHPSLLLWRSGPGRGSYAGLAVTDGINGGAGFLVRSETQLALDLVTAASGDPLNPARGLLPRATLVRRDQDSNLVTGDPFLTVTMALEPVAVDLPPMIPIAVNDLAAGTASAASSASAAGRGITVDDLTSSCENLLTPFDQHIFTILSRTVRVSQCAFSSCNPDGSAYTITLFRGADPQTYRANAYLYADLCGDNGCSYVLSEKVAYEFKMSWDATGSLTTGEVTVLPTCPGSPIACSYGGGYPLFVLPPLWAGHAHQGQHLFDLGARVGNDNPESPLRPQAAINWQALLARSAWN